MSEYGAEKLWDGLWREEKKLPGLDSGRNMVLGVMLRECCDVKGKKMLDAGSGAGVESAVLAERGARVTLLDTSPTAIEISKRVFANRKQRGRFVRGSFFDAPFKAGTFDVVWNAGVLEHFTRAEQKKMLSEFNRVLKKGGIFVTLNPSTNAMIYRFGMWIGLNLGNWRSGKEFPIKSLAGLFDEAGFETLREYRIGFLEELRFLCHCPVFLPFTYILGKIKRYSAVQKLNALPGYIIVSVGRKK